MNVRLKFSLWLAAFVAGGFAAIATAGWLIARTLPPADLATVLAILEPRGALVVVLALLPVFGWAAILAWIFRDYVLAARRLADQTRIVFAANSEHRIRPRGASEIVELSESVNRMADAYHQLKVDLEARVAAAGARLEEERNRLASLMAELSEGVLLCNDEGRILLYNERARGLFGGDPVAGAGRGLVGLGRSVFSLLPRDPVVHALEKLRHALDQGEALPSTRFVTNAVTGALVKVNMAPYMAADGRLAGMVLALEDVTEMMARENRRRSLLRTFAVGVRAPVASLAAAAEQLVSGAALDEDHRCRAAESIAADAHRLSAMINEWLADYSEALKAGIALEDMRAGDLLFVARRRIEQAVGLPCATEPAPEGMWIKADSFALVEALAFLAGNLHENYGVRSVGLRASAQGEFVGVDLTWTGAIVSHDAISLWEGEPMQVGELRTPLTLGDVLERHGGEVWLQGHKASQMHWFRMLLPLGSPVAPAAHRAAEAASRPEYYDFDLFHPTEIAKDLLERRLADLHYTVFDTETTGLEPSAGDEIISLGAVRVVNGRLLKREVFEQLVDPQRPVSEASTRIHGIRSEDLRGQPTMAQALPQFHRFCEDTVLVAHNAAFDMRFLELKEAATGVRFGQPVLDTLLLSAIVHPMEEDHGLATIAERLGVSVVGRHTALGDALVTGEIFLRLLPLLAEKGITTLGQALDASRETYYARLKY